MTENYNENNRKKRTSEMREHRRARYNEFLDLFLELFQKDNLYFMDLWAGLYQ